MTSANIRHGVSCKTSYFKKSDGCTQHLLLLFQMSRFWIVNLPPWELWRDRFQHFSYQILLQTHTETAPLSKDRLMQQQQTLTSKCHSLKLLVKAATCEADRTSSHASVEFQRVLEVVDEGSVFSAHWLTVSSPSKQSVKICDSFKKSPEEVTAQLSLLRDKHNSIKTGGKQKNKKPDFS